jgi:hypothetical protein
MQRFVYSTGHFKKHFMKKIASNLTLSLLISFLAACSVEPVTPPPGETDCIIPSEVITATSSKEFDQNVLRKLSEAVYAESRSNFCQRGDVWGIAGVGAKPCGGPWGYLPYKKSNKQCFLKVLERYNQQSQVYNKKYQIVSNCMVDPEPKSVVCEEGKPVLVY